VPEPFWRRELNDVVVESSGGPVAISTVRFSRSAQ
jgi:hypothetical protein